MKENYILTGSKQQQQKIYQVAVKLIKVVGLFYFYEAFRLNFDSLPNSFVLVGESQNILIISAQLANQNYPGIIIDHKNNEMAKLNQANYQNCKWGFN